jgi:hypothetical protein
MTLTIFRHFSKRQTSFSLAKTVALVGALASGDGELYKHLQFYFVVTHIFVIYH